MASASPAIDQSPFVVGKHEAKGCCLLQKGLQGYVFAKVNPVSPTLVFVLRW